MPQRIKASRTKFRQVLGMILDKKIPLKVRIKFCETVTQSELYEAEIGEHANTRRRNLGKNRDVNA